MLVKQALVSGNQPSDNAGKSDIELRLHELKQALQHNQADSSTIQYCKRELDMLMSEQHHNRSEQKASHHEHISNLMQFVTRDSSENFFQQLFGKKMMAHNVMITILGILMIAIGFTMIVLPAPHDFEIYTIYYFNPNDGFTLMDLFSLMIVFGGVFLLIRNITKREL